MAVEALASSLSGAQTGMGPTRNAVAARRDVRTQLNYYRDPGDGSAPTPVVVGSTKVTNERPTVPLAATVTDISGEEDKYRLDTHGFQLVRHRSREADFADEISLKRDYYKEMEQLYKDVSTCSYFAFSSSTGCSRAVIFGHRVRRGPSHWHSLGEGNAANRGPLHRVHVDQSYDGARLVAEKHLSASESADLLRPDSGRRYQIVNIWRPIRPVLRDPLAVADARTVSDRDLVAASVLYQNGSRNETWAVRPNDEHRWYFKNGQTPDEVLFIKCFDSKGRTGEGEGEDVEALARRTPHCAFVDPDHTEEESRESVEVRALLFYD